MKYILLLSYNRRAKITSRKPSGLRTHHSSTYKARQLEATAWNCSMTVKCSVTCIKDLFTVFRYMIILFYVYGSVHRWSILIIVQRDATQSSLFIILQVHSTFFWCQSHPSAGVHKTVTTASCTGHNFCAATSLQLGQANLVALEGGSCSTGGLVSVLCTPDDGCGWHPKHVEWTCRIINRLLCVASRWTIIHLPTTKTSSVTV